jgi:RHS repeat-associated protein
MKTPLKKIRGSRTRMEDSTGITTYTYDELRRPRAVTYPAGKTLTYVYDAMGNRSTLTDPDGGVTTYSYDSRNALSWLVNPLSERTTWLHDALGRVTTMTHANASVAEHDYDAGGRITAVRNLKSDRSVISVFTYSYDAVANRTGVAEANGDLVTWSYDEAYQLTREQRSGANAYDTTFTYDGVGNRLTQIASGATTTYSYDAANELTTSEDSTGLTTFTYDAHGNTSLKVEPNGNRTTYSWDAENMLTQVALPAGTTSTFVYDGERRLRSKTEASATTNFIRDIERVLMEADSGWSTLARYTGRGGGWYDPLVAMRRANASSLYHFDALGSADRLSDITQAITDSYLYRAFGLDTVLSGTTTNPYRFVAALGYHKTMASLLHLGARYYMSEVGRFAQRDPSGYRYNLNLYSYVYQSPTGLVDPEGLGIWDWRGWPWNWFKPRPQPKPTPGPQPPGGGCPPPPKSCPRPPKPDFDQRAWWEKVRDIIETSGGAAVPGSQFVTAARGAPEAARTWIECRLRDRRDELIAEGWEQEDPRIDAYDLLLRQIAAGGQ